MSDNRSDNQGDMPAGGDRESELVSRLVREHAPRPPYDAVDFTSLTARIVAGASDDLERRRGVNGFPQPLSARRRGRVWWEVTAGWARPAMAAAIGTIAVTGALVLATSETPVGATSIDSTTTASPAVSASVDGRDASVFGSLTGTSTSPEIAPVSADSLLSALVDGR